MKRTMIHTRVMILFCLLLFIASGARLQAEEQFSFIGLQGKWISRIIVDPQNSDIIYALSSFPYRLYKTVNRGRDWILLWDRAEIRYLFIHPQNHSYLYGAGDGFYFSPDGGQNWNKVSNEVLTDCSMDPLKPYVFLSILSQSVPNEIVRSTDSGATWSPVRTIVPNSQYPLLTGVNLRPHPTDPNLIFVTVSEKDAPCVSTYHYYLLFSSDGGDHWIETEWDHNTQLFIDYFPELMIKGFSNLTKSIDLGLTWMDDMYGLPEKTYVSDVYSDPLLPGAMYASTHGKADGLYWRPHHSLPWQYLGGRELDIKEVAIDKLNAIIYLGTYNGIWTNKPAVFIQPPHVEFAIPQQAEPLYGTVTLQGKALGFNSIDKIEISIDDTLAATIPGNKGVEQEFVWSWDTRMQSFGDHEIRVKAIDSGMYYDMMERKVKVGNILLGLKAERATDRSWMMRRSGVKLTIGVENRGGVANAGYQIYRRKKNQSTWTLIRGFTEAQVKDGSYTYFDKLPRTFLIYEYQVKALSQGVVQGVSETVEIQ